MKYNILDITDLVESKIEPFFSFRRNDIIRWTVFTLFRFRFFDDGDVSFFLNRHSPSSHNHDKYTWFLYKTTEYVFFHFLDTHVERTLARTKRVCKMTTVPAKRHTENRINRRRPILYYALAHTTIALFKNTHIHIHT